MAEWNGTSGYMSAGLDQDIVNNGKERQAGETKMVGEKIQVAICIPYYKKIKELKRLLYSILNQEFEDYVVFVTDDGADDEAQKFIGNLGDRFRYSRNKEQLGPTRNCNHAVRLAGQYAPAYIKIMHHDDYFYDKESLRKYVEMLERDENAILAFSGSGTDVGMGQAFYERSAKTEEINDLRGNKYSVLNGNFIGAPSAVLVRNQGILMDENLTWLVDMDWYIKLLEYQNCFAYTFEPLVVTGMDGNRVTDICIKDRELVQKEWLYVYLKHSAMQDFSHLDSIIRQCLIYYKKESGYWHEDDYLAILKDAVNDGKRICVWGEKEEIEKKRCLFQEKGMRIDGYIDADGETEKQNTDNGIFPMSLETLEKRKKDYFCLVMLNPAKEARRVLASKGINSLPYMEKYIRKMNCVYGGL